MLTQAMIQITTLMMRKVLYQAYSIPLTLKIGEAKHHHHNPVAFDMAYLHHRTVLHSVSGCLVDVTQDIDIIVKCLQLFCTLNCYLYVML